MRACHREIFTAIQHFSRIERVPTWQQLELNVFRTAAAYVLDMLRSEVSALWVVLCLHSAYVRRCA